MDPLALVQINNFDGVIAERTNKQSFASRIKREMVDPPFDARERDRLIQLKCLLLGMNGVWINAGRRHQSYM